MFIKADRSVSVLSPFSVLSFVTECLVPDVSFDIHVVVSPRCVFTKCVGNGGHGLWIDLAHGWDRFRAVVNVVMNLRVL